MYSWQWQSLATSDLYYKNFLSEKLLGVNCAMTSEGIDCVTIKFVIIYILSSAASHGKKLIMNKFQIFRLNFS